MQKKTPKITKAMANNLETLNTYISANDTTQSLMNTTKPLYITRDIFKITQAISPMELLKANDFDELNRIFLKLTKQIEKKQGKQHTRRDEEEETRNAGITEVVQKLEKKLKRPDIKTTNWESEAPSSKVILKRPIKDFDEAWRATWKLLAKAVEAHLTQQLPNLELMIGPTTQQSSKP
jgi:hypothetical protein